jgi:hypothetical protein
MKKIMTMMVNRMTILIDLLIRKKTSYVIACIGGILIITNSSTDEFRSYRHAAPNNYRTSMGRDSNFFIFSLYSDNEDGRRTYLGIFGNFFRL